MGKPKRLTNRRVGAAPRKSGDRWMSDNDGGRGTGRLLARIGQHTRLFYFRYSEAGRVHVIALGRYSQEERTGYLTLEQAKEIALRGALLLRKGPVTDMYSALGVAAPLASQRSMTMPHSGGDSTAVSTVLDLCREYQAYLKKEKSRASEQACRLSIKNYIEGSRLARLSPSAVTIDDAASLIRQVAERKSHDKANRVRGLLAAAYGLAKRARTDPDASESLSRLRIDHNPFSELAKMRVKNVPLDRVLTSAEIGYFWIELNCARLAKTVAYRAIRLTILLGGQRAQQLIRAGPRDVNVHEGTLRLFDPKGRRDEPRLHYLPLSQLAMDEVAPLLAECDATGRSFLFGQQGKLDVHVNPSTISTAVTRISKRLIEAKWIDRPFSYLDIRRTIETRMGELGVLQEHRAQIQSHDLGGVQIVHYNRSLFLKEKRAGLACWEQYVLQCADAVRSGTRLPDAREP